MLKKQTDPHDKFFKSIEGLRTTLQDLYSKEAFKAMHEAFERTLSTAINARGAHYGAGR